MQSKDITVGRFYAYSTESPSSRYSSMDRAVKVKVLKTGVEFIPDTRGFSRHKQTKVNGVKIQQGKREPMVVDPKTLRCTWVEEADRRATAAAFVAQRAEEKVSLLLHRAIKARGLHSMLLAKGVEPKPESVYDDEEREALVAAGFEVAQTSYSNSTHYLSSALPGLSALMEKGVVPLDVTLLLVGLSDNKPEHDEDWEVED